MGDPRHLDSAHHDLCATDAIITRDFVSAVQSNDSKVAFVQDVIAALKNRVH